MQCSDFTGTPHCLLGRRYIVFRADILHGPMQIYCNGCRRYLKRATQYYCYGNWDLFHSRKSRQSRQRLRAIFREIREREIITLVFSSDAARRRPYPLTPLLRRICYSQFLSIRVCDPTTENMFFCSSVKRSHYSLLKSHCRFPSLQTADVCGTSEYHGFKNPRLFALSGIASFRRHYLYIITEKRKRLEDGNRKPSSSKTHYSKLITRN